MKIEDHDETISLSSFHTDDCAFLHCVVTVLAAAIWLTANMRGWAATANAVFVSVGGEGWAATAILHSFSH
jgi:hypothetical protein